MQPLKIDPNPRLEPAPEATAFDFGLAVAKAGAQVFPFLGVGVALFDLIAAPSRGKRYSDWCEDLRLRFNELSGQVAGLTPERLAQDEAFNSAFHQATHAALRTHQTEKLAALRNAVLNVAIGTAPADDLQLVFLTFVDGFAPIHLRVLTFFQNREAEAVNRFRQQRDLTDSAVRELESRGLVKDTRPYVARNRETQDVLLVEPWQITDLGKQFLDFIKAPGVVTP